MRRLELRPVVSRRLRAALLLVLLLSVISLAQTSLESWALALAAACLLAVFIQAWRAASRVPPGLLLMFRPLEAASLTMTGEALPLYCTRLSVYPCLIVLHAEDSHKTRQIIVLLPDSLPGDHGDQWRQLLIWAKRMRRHIALA